MSDKLSVERQIQVHQLALSRLLEEKERLDARPEEPKMGSLINFKHSYHPYGMEYDFAALRTPTGWYLTGQQTQSLSWAALLDFVEEGCGDNSIRLATHSRTL